MAWKSRIGKLPPANYYAQIMAYLSQAYPDAAITQQTMEALKPAWDDLWQNGRSAEIVAKTTCSCDGKHITLSPAFGLHIPKGAFRAPTKTERGQLFEPTRMRESAGIERTKRQASVLEAQIGRISTETSRLESRTARAKKPEVRKRLADELKTRMAALEVKKQEAAKIGKQLDALRAQIGAVDLKALLGRSGEETAPTPKPERKPQAQASKPAPKEPKKVQAPKKEKPPKKEKASKADKDKLILEAVKAALPDVATKLAAQLKAG